MNIYGHLLQYVYFLHVEIHFHVVEVSRPSNDDLGVKVNGSQSAAKPSSTEERRLLTRQVDIDYRVR